MRALYLMLSKWWGDEPIPSAPSDSWPQERLRSSQTWSRYFLVGNVIRAGTLSPVLGFAISHPFPLILALLSYSLLAHLLLVGIEIYKQALITKLLPQSLDTPYKQRPKYPDLVEVTRQRLHLFPCETSRFYQAMGMEFFRKLVTWYVHEAMGMSSVRFMDRSGRRAAIDFAMEAHTAESIHCKGAAINSIMLIQLAGHAPAWLEVWLGIWVFAEWFLVLHQRYMRVRVFEALTNRPGRVR